MRSLCPEALYGQHGNANSNGRCPYCSEKISSRRSYGPSRGNNSISREQEAYLDSRRNERDIWGQLVVPQEQDPLGIDPDESLYYEI